MKNDRLLRWNRQLTTHWQQPPSHPRRRVSREKIWIPACAGMTEECERITNLTTLVLLAMNLLKQAVKQYELDSGKTW